ncbi:hypothetical protein E2C01_088707 [Portunus trituberculatus]|uniref:Uncharacterized protein n=1 Tax=Portunus trituberculatus TaxID=210409 RepID=A0A5B7JGS4_PORTR|nr:hypothetical protein [Portunus trituberculatus]
MHGVPSRPCHQGGGGEGAAPGRQAGPRCLRKHCCDKTLPVPPYLIPSNPSRLAPASATPLDAFLAQGSKARAVKKVPRVICLMYFCDLRKTLGMSRLTSQGVFMRRRREGVLHLAECEYRWLDEIEDLLFSFSERLHLLFLLGF